ncbi:MAG: hypothetical protein QXT59_05215 [Zestosphaera sp.]
MKGLSSLVVALLLLSVVVPASAILVSRVREYTNAVRSQVTPTQPATLAAYLLKNNDKDLLIVCNYGLRIIEDIQVLDDLGNRAKLVNSLAPKTCYLTILPARNWHSLIVGNQVVNVLRVS